jgi:beta-galactosidase beta subunit
MFNCNWIHTRWQQYGTHLHTNSTQNTENGTYITIKKIYCLIWEVQAVPHLCKLYPGIYLTTEENVYRNFNS